MINEFSRSDLMLGRRGFLGTSLAVSAGPALIEPMQRWLVPSPVVPGGAVLRARPHPGRRRRGDGAGRPPGDGTAGDAAATPDCAPPGAASARRSEKLSMPEVELLEQTTVMFRQWDAQCGGGLRRKAVVGQLHEITDLLQEQHTEAVGRRLFRVTAELAELAGWMSYDVGLQPTAQKYFVLALHAAKEAGDRPLGSYVLSKMGRQMIHLGRPDDALELIHLAQYGSRDARDRPYAGDAATPWRPAPTRTWASPGSAGARCAWPRRLSRTPVPATATRTGSASSPRPS